MMRFLTLLFVAVLFALPSMAQEESSEAVEADKVIEEAVDIEEGAQSRNANYEERLELSKKMHEIWPIREKIEGALDVIAEQLPQQERLKFKTALRKSIKFDALEQASIDAMADIFNKAELEKMIDFYGSKEGRSVSYKTKDYEKALQPMMMKMMDKALLDAKLGTQ